MSDHHQQGLAMIRNHLGVSRETEDRLVTYVDLLMKWQRKINLVGGKTLEDVWLRHILDSAQIYPLMSGEEVKIMDVGSGAGLPGLIVAILRAGEYGGEAQPVTTVESDQRKCAFLATAARECGVTITIENKRLELLSPQHPDVITARALASLEKLLQWTRAQHHANLKCVFLKGVKLDEELTCLGDYPNIRTEKKQSLTGDDGVILTLSGFQS
jgi:16S rRNA (guanine527-N7)-methyltransferase